MDVAPVFDKVWRKEVVNKLEHILQKQCVQTPKSYIAERLLRGKEKDVYSKVKETKAGFPKSSVLGPVLYLLFTYYDIPEIESVKMDSFDDNTALLTVEADVNKGARSR